MRPKSLAVLATVVLGLGAFIFFVERDLPSSEERAEQAKKVLAFEREEVDALTLRPQGVSSPIELVRQQESAEELPPSASRWRLVAPLEAPADDGAIDRLLVVLHDLEKRRTLEDMPRSDAGLDPPRAVLTLSRGGESTTLEIGAEVPGSQNTLLAIADRDDVYVVADELLDSIDRSVEEWRNHRLFPARREQIETVRLVEGERVVVLSRRGEELWLEQPLRDRADRELGNGLLSSLVGLEAKSFLDEEPAPVGAAAGGLVVVELAGRDEPWRVELGAAPEPGRGGDTDEVDALVGGVAARIRGLVEAVHRDAAAWRSHALLPLPVYRVDRIVIRDGSSELILEREGGDWLRGEDRVSFTTINDLLYELDDVRAAGFAPAAGLAEGAPRLTIELTAGGGEEVASAQEVRVFVAGGETLALVSDRPDALRLPAATLDALAAKIAAVREAEPLPPQPATAGDGDGDH